MKVVLSTLNAKYIHSSLALAYLEEACHSDSWEIETLEFTINDKLDQIMTRLYRSQPDVLCFSTYIWNIKETLSLCHDFKKVSPECLIILGGPEVSYDSASVLEEHPSIDYIVRGEGEISLRELLGQIFAEKDVENISGITYRYQGQIKENSDRPLITELGSLPSPFGRDFTPYKDRVVYYESSRGCPFNCSYCLSSTARGVRFFPMDRVKEELKHLLKYELREIKLVDRTFNCNEKRAQEIMQFIVEQGSSTKVHLEICADVISDEFLEFLSKMPPNIFNFEIGIQSTCPEALQAVHRFSHWENLRKNILQLRSFNNIHLHLDLIAGLPYESYDRFQDSFNNVFSLQPHMLQLGFLKLLKGSEIYRQRHKHGYRFQTRPPYQVLANNYISYDEIIKLQQIEELLNRYYNKAIVPTTIAHAISTVYQGSAFIFFEDFALYWEENELFGRGHRRVKEYDILLEFLNYHWPDRKKEWNELIKYDFLHRNLPHPFPKSIKRIKLEEGRDLLNTCLQDQSFLDSLPDSLPGTRQEIRKHLYLEHFAFNPFTFTPLDESLPLIFIYHPIKKKAVDVINAAEGQVFTRHLS
jgi:radical SAM superfamily enzyme YgiQ (UPF0313 family)